MKVYVQGLSALAHYRSSDAMTDIERCPRGARLLEDATSSRRACIDAGIKSLGIGEPTLERPLEVLVPESRLRSRSEAVTARVWRGPVPPTAFRAVNRNVYVSSPEFLFLQMTSRLDLPELVALGMELCGTYRRDVEIPSLGTKDTKRITVYNQPILSTPKRLRGFVESMRKSPGYPKACIALRYVLPGSASPMETALYMLLCLPRRLGGYALPKPILNPPIVLTKAGRRHTLRNLAKPDLYWKDERIDLEYNSNEFHDENQRAIDSMRRKALERMNVEVIEITRDELFSSELLHATVLRIARRLKKKLRPEGEGGFANKRANLRQRLLIEDTKETPAIEKEGVAEAAPDSDEIVWVDDDTRASWEEEYPNDPTWTDDEMQLDSTWSVEMQIWDDDELYVYGRGTRGRGSRKEDGH